MKSKLIWVFLAVFLLAIVFVKPVQTRVLENIEELPNVVNIQNMVYLIAFDESGSMAPYFQEAKKSLNQQLDQMNSNDVLYLYTFGTNTKPLINEKNPIKDKTEIKKKISSIQIVNNGWTYIANMLRVTNRKQFEIDKKYRFHNKLFIVYSDNINDPPPQFRSKDRVDLADKFKQEFFKGWGKFYLQTPSEQPAECIEEVKTVKNESDKKQKIEVLKNKENKTLTKKEETPIIEDEKIEKSEELITENKETHEENYSETQDTMQNTKEENQNKVSQVDSKEKENLTIDSVEEEIIDETKIAKKKNKNGKYITYCNHNSKLTASLVGAQVLNINNKDTDRIINLITGPFRYIENLHLVLTTILIVYLLNLFIQHFFYENQLLIKFISIFLSLIFLPDVIGLLKGISNTIRAIPNSIMNLISNISGTENYSLIFFILNVLLGLVTYFVIFQLIKKYKNN
jgi:hypothetical protein